MPDAYRSSTCDYYDFLTSGKREADITNRGPSRTERRHQVTVGGPYTALSGLTLGLLSYWRSGARATLGFATEYGSYEYFLRPRTEHERMAAIYDADLTLTYPIALRRLKASARLDLLNLLNTQHELQVDPRWSFSEADNRLPIPRNPSFSAPSVRTDPGASTLAYGLSGRTAA